MSNFQSYQSYVPAGNEELFAEAPQIREESQVFRTSSTNGVMTETSEKSIDRGNEGQLNPNHGDGSWKATATTKTGRPVSQITGDSLVTIAGIQGSVDFFVAEGYLQKTPDGSYAEGSGPVEAPAEIQGDVAPIPDHIMQAVNAALDPLPQEALSMVTSIGISVALGRTDDSALTAHFAKASGIELADAGQRLSAVKAVYSAQANAAIQSRAGIGAEDQAEFWQWARTHHAAQLQDALGKQLYSSDMSGYANLANRWMSSTAPSVDALKAAGIPTRKGSSGAYECQVRGQWMGLGAAAKAGLV